MKKLKYGLSILIFTLLMQLVAFYPSSNATTTINTYCPACILMETSTGKILYEKDAYKIRYPASTTKIMTAILALEHCKLTDVATVSHNAIYSVPPSYVHASLQEGEELTVEQLLNVLLIPSANDAANVLAEHISGSVERFADLMNEKAKEIGCLNTHFVNPNGVHSDEHVTTAYDLALMGKYAMQNSTFREIVQKTKYTLPTTNKYNKTDRTFVNTNSLIQKSDSKAKDNYYYSNCIGGKTGYTTNAGNCIVTEAEKDGMSVVVVVLGGVQTSDGLSGRFLDCINLFNYAFENYSMQTVNEKNSVVKQITVSGASSDTKDLNVLAKDEISILVAKNSKETVAPEVVLNDDLKAPIEANTTIGKITYVVDGITYSSDLIAQTSVIASGFFSILVRIVLILVTVYLIYLLLRTPKGGNSSSKKSKKKGKHSPKNGKGNFKGLLLK